MANEKFLNSSQVNVYPSGYRSATKDLEASRTTEGSVTKGIKALADNHSFIQLNGTTMTIVLGGYIFTIKDAINNIGSLFTGTSSQKIWAVLKIGDFGQQDESSNTLKMLVNVETGTNLVDEDGKFKGIGFTDVEPDDSLFPINLPILGHSISDVSGDLWWYLSDALIKSNQIRTEQLYIKNIYSQNENGDFNISANHINLNAKINFTGAVYTFNNVGTIQFNNTYLNPTSSEPSKLIYINQSGEINATNVASSYSGNSLKTLTSIQQNSTGKIISATFTDIPYATTTSAGLVNIDDQNFKGVKGFVDGIKTQEINFADPTDDSGNNYYPSIIGSSRSSSIEEVKLKFYDLTTFKDPSNNEVEMFKFSNLTERSYDSQTMDSYGNANIGELYTPRVRIGLPYVSFTPEYNVDLSPTLVNLGVETTGRAVNLEHCDLGISTYKPTVLRRWIPFKFLHEGVFENHGLYIWETDYPFEAEHKFSLTNNSGVLKLSYNGNEALKVTPTTGHIESNTTNGYNLLANAIKVSTSEPIEAWDTSGYTINSYKVVALTSEPSSYQPGYIYLITD